MTAVEAIEILKTDMGCYECTFGCNTPYKCKNNDCPFRKAIHLAVERLQIDLLPRMIKSEPQTDCNRCRHFATDICRECYGNELFDESGYITEITNTPQTEREGE